VQDSGPTDAEVPPVVQLPSCQPTLSSLREDLFEQTCQWSACHGRGTPAWDLILTEEPAILGMVGAKAASCPGWLLVSPGRPDESLLYRKVADERPPCGERMPWGAGILPPHALACVREWIEGLAGVGRDAAPDAE